MVALLPAFLSDGLVFGFLFFGHGRERQTERQTKRLRDADQKPNSWPFRVYTEIAEIRQCGNNWSFKSFPRSQSLSREALYQGTGYRHFYLRAQELSADRLQAVIVSAKTPGEQFRKRFGYVATDTPGVLRSGNPMLDILPILVLNELSDAPHNLYVKCFASRRKVRMRAFQKLFTLVWKKCTRTTHALLYGNQKRVNLF